MWDAIEELPEPISVNNIVDWYQDEISNWNFYSDTQRAGMENGHIIVCLRSYDWYITKDKIEDVEIAIKGPNGMYSSVFLIGLS